MTDSTHTAAQNAQSLPIKADIHAHTYFSHGQASVKEMYEAARNIGLEIFGFSEHSPRPAEYAYPTDYQEKLWKNMPVYVEEIQALQKIAAKDGMQILLGMEVDYFPEREDFARELIAKYPFDYLIGGLHFQNAWGFDFSGDDWDKMDEESRFASYEKYYLDLAAMCRSGMFHVAAHPDLIKIFTIDTFNKWLERPEAIPLIREALTSVRDNNMIMEISSAGLRKPCNEIYPGPTVMKLAAELDIPISFASDAHCTNTPAFAFDVLARYADSYGYTHSNVYIKGKRVSLPFAKGISL